MISSHIDIGGSESLSTVPVLPPVPGPVPVTQMARVYRQPELRRIVAALLAKSSILVVGAEGSGKSYLANIVLDELRGQGFEVSYLQPATPRNMLLELADSFDIEKTDLSGKSLTIDGLKVALAVYFQTNITFLIIDDAHRISTPMRLWLKDLRKQGQPMLVFATEPPKSDLFLSLAPMSLTPLPDYAIREVMEQAALDYGLSLTHSDLARLQQIAAGNPALARRAIEAEYLGLVAETSDSNEFYADATPVLVAFFTVFLVMRYLAMGVHNQSLYIFSGVMAAVLMGLTKLTRAIPRESKRFK